jgi:hypothetical protein
MSTPAKQNHSHGAAAVAGVHNRSNVARAGPEAIAASIAFSYYS